MMKVVSLLFTGLMLCTVSALAQPASGTSSDTNMEILKEKLKADKKLLVAGNMDLSDAEAKKFWPLYDSYQMDLNQVNLKLGETIKTRLTRRSPPNQNGAIGRWKACAR